VTLIQGVQPSREGVRCLHVHNLIW
jgi:hypothetical protein